MKQDLECGHCLKGEGSEHGDLSKGAKVELVCRTENYE
jgi:hypothetical protein